MKQFNKLVLMSVFLLSTSQVFASGAKLPDLSGVTTGTGSSSDTSGSPPLTTQTPTPAPTTQVPGPVPTPPIVPPTTSKGVYVDQIKTLASNSSCTSYSWSARGKAPSGYIKGVSLSFARSLCRLKKQTTLSGILSKADSHNDAKDALTHYATNFANLPIDINTAGQGPMRALYTLGMGLGMRESSGNYCEGWDKSAGSNRSSSAAEAGAFQTSYDSMGASPELSKLYAEYQATPGRCYLDVFKVGAASCSGSNLGTGAGVIYQAFNKSCPAFATEYAMTMLRIQRSHYGPINRKEAEVVPACGQLLKSVQDLINNDPYACEDLI